MKQEKKKKKTKMRIPNVENIHKINMKEYYSICYVQWIVPFNQERYNIESYVVNITIIFFNNKYKPLYTTRQIHF